MTKQLILRASLAALAIGIGGLAGAQTVGVNSAVVNDVRMTTQANPQAHPAQVKERVSLGNQIATGRGSALQVLLLDRTNFQVGANARITVDKFVYDPARSASAVGVSVAKGAFRFMSGKPTHANPGQSSIKTPVASIGIRGTIVEGVVGDDAIGIAQREAGVPGVTGADAATASLILLRGPGAGARGEAVGAIDVTAGGKTVAVEQGGYAVFVPGPGQAPIGPFLLSDAGLARLAALLNDPRRRGTATFGDPLVRNPVIDWFFQRSGEEGYYDGPYPQPSDRIF